MRDAPMEELVSVATLVNEKDRAVQIRATIWGKLEEICGLMDEANKYGMRIEFQMGMSHLGRNAVARLEVLKVVAP